MKEINVQPRWADEKAGIPFFHLLRAERYSPPNYGVAEGIPFKLETLNRRARVRIVIKGQQLKSTKYLGICLASIYLKSRL